MSDYDIYLNKLENLLAESTILLGLIKYGCLREHANLFSFIANKNECLECHE